MRKLSEWGVSALGDDVYKEHEPATGEQYIHRFPSHLAWQALFDHPWHRNGV